MTGCLTQCMRKSSARELVDAEASGRRAGWRFDRGMARRGGVLAGLAWLLTACVSLPDERPARPPPPPRSTPAPSAEPTPTPATPPSATPPTPVPAPTPAPAPAVVNAADVRALALQALPASLPARADWADDIATSFAALGIPALPGKLCALAAVIEQESGWQADPPVAGLPRIAWAELEKKRARFGIPKGVMMLALAKTSRTGRSYRARIDSLRTERELSVLYEDMIDEIPLGKRLLGGQNPVRTGGATQVSVGFAAQQMAERSYPWQPAGGARAEVFKRRGGVYFGAAMLLDYPVSYSRMLYRFADYNAGRYSSRNAAFQAVLARLSGQTIVLDGDLLRYRDGQPEPARSATSQAWRALSTLQLGLPLAQIEHDLKLEKRFEFEQSPTYLRTLALAERRALALPRERVPELQLHSPKIKRSLTTAWFAERCEARFRTCLARLAAADD